MRPGQKNNRSRGRGNGGGGGGRKHVNPLSRSYESNGPDVKVRGNPATIAEKYVQLARDAHASGDSVNSENYYQHAEHYFRIISAAQAHTQARQEERDRAQAERGETAPEENRSDNQTSKAENTPVEPAVVKEADAPVEASSSDEKPSGGEEETPRPRRAPRARRPRRKPVENAELAEAPQPSMNLAEPEPKKVEPAVEAVKEEKAPPAVKKTPKAKGDDSPAKEAAE
ncbi:DUF4167 domain-containing protein [uncultured Maritalea sp.]|uniref:DUF4167 domain-containing protein n=1 Tax=uncultured Maritalea sp. TaxID=757249 RepID=UPI00260C152A|nr:DUF4167 domain-containing protein [uncultured Maritalea sp.]